LEAVELLLSLGADLLAVPQASRKSSRARSTTSSRNGISANMFSSVQSGVSEMPSFKPDRNTMPFSCGAVSAALLYPTATTRRAMMTHMVWHLVSGQIVSKRNADGNTGMSPETALEDLIRSEPEVMAGVGRTGDTPLLAAARAAQYGLASTLVRNRANPNALGADGASPLILAAAGGDGPLAEVLLTHGADMFAATAAGLTAFDAALEGGHRNVVQLLQAKDVHKAASDGNEEAIQVALDHGVDPNAMDPKTGCSLLVVAVQKGLNGMCQMLLQRKADPGQEAAGFTPVYVAAQKGHIEVVYSLVAASADCNVAIASGELPLNTALKCKKQRLALVSALVQAKAEVNLANKKGVLPLLVAVESKSDQGVIDVLLGAGADVQCLNIEGLSMLHQVCKKITAASLVSVQNLLKLKCPPDIRHRESGVTPLQAASGMPKGSDVVAALLAARADVNDVPSPGESGIRYTALQVAVAAGMRDTVKVLLGASGLDTAVAGDRAGEAVTALDLTTDDELIHAIEHVADSQGVERGSRRIATLVASALSANQVEEVGKIHEEGTNDDEEPGLQLERDLLSPRSRAATFPLPSRDVQEIASGARVSLAESPKRQHRSSVEIPPSFNIAKQSPTTPRATEVAAPVAGDSVATADCVGSAEAQAADASGRTARVCHRVEGGSARETLPSLGDGEGGVGPAAADDELAVEIEVGDMADAPGPGADTPATQLLAPPRRGAPLH